MLIHKLSSNCGCVFWGVVAGYFDASPRVCLVLTIKSLQLLIAIKLRLLNGDEKYSSEDYDLFMCFYFLD